MKKKSVKEKSEKVLVITETDNPMVPVIQEYEKISNQIKVFKEKEKLLKDKLKEFDFDKVLIEIPGYEKVIGITQYETKKKVLDEDKLKQAFNIADDELESFKDIKIIKAIKITIK